MKEKTTSERYTAAINTAMTIISMRKDIESPMDIIHNNLTVSELIGGCYDKESVNDAVKNAEVGIIRNDHTNAECVFMKGRVHLHEFPDLGRTAMKNVIEESKAKINLPK